MEPLNAMPDQQSALATRQADRSLTLITKRTYRIAADEAAEVAGEQIPLLHDVTLDPERGYLRDDLDLCVQKHRTDVVVQCAAHAPKGRAVSTLEASVSVGNHSKRILVLGDRCCRYSAGQLRFEDPEPFESMPVIYTRAYGGSDEPVRLELDERVRALQAYTQLNIRQLNLGMYLRNPVGLGYVIREGEGMDGLRLPNLEDPDERLTPENLAVKDANRWYRQPLPACFDWLPYEWFPRCAHLGHTFGAGQREDLPRPGDPPIREVRMGLLDPEIFTPKPLLELISDQVTNGASPGLAVPHLSGDEPVQLVHLDPEHPQFSFRLPGERPRLFVTPLDEDRRELEPVLLSVIVHKERNLLSLVWGGRTQTIMPYGPEQKQKVPFEVLWK